MPLIRAEDIPQLGIAELDAQHHGMGTLLNRIAAGLGSPLPDGNASPPGAMMALLVARTQAHFLFEEQLMAEMGHPGLAEHRQEHRMLLAELKSFATKVEEGSEVPDQRTLTALKDWFIVHIVSYDRHLVAQPVRFRAAP